MSADYHEFGMNMEGRGFSGSLNYRFGYQGSEKDNEVNSSKGTSYTTEFRQLDTRLGRWFSSDPVFQPWQSSYTSMDNNPINLTDVRGNVTGDEEESKSDDSTIEVDKGSKERGQLDNARLGGKFKGGKYTDKEGNEYSYKFRGKEIVYYKKIPKPADIKNEEEATETTETPEAPQDLAIYVAFPEMEVKVGKNDKSVINDLINEAPEFTQGALRSQKWPAGHAGVIVISGKTGEATYSDFGRYPGSTDGNGTTRINPNEMRLPDAKFNKKDGRLLNAREILNSLLASNTFPSKQYGHTLLYATSAGVNYESMMGFIESNGNQEYGFGDGQTYCAKFASDVITKGGGTMTSWDLQQLVDDAREIIKVKGFIKSIDDIKILVKRGPTGENIIKSIKNRNPELPSGRIKF
jgi:RHS repeat-associated protein